MELKKYKLGDIAEIISGVAFQPSDICNEGVRILRGGNIQSKRIMLKDDDVNLPLSYTNEYNQIRVGDTILVASTGSVDVLGKAATCFTEMPNTQIGAFLRIIRPKNECYAMLISIALNSEYFAKYIKAQARGTSINNITNGYLKEFEIYCPENYLPISDLYLSFEKKIALNRQINQNLEEMAKQLYDYWFVQFDFPNEEGKPYKSSGGKIIYNPKLKREIPEGWEVKSINDLSTICRGVSYKPTDLQEKGVLILRGNNIENNRIVYDNNTAFLLSNMISDEQKIRQYDIIITMSSGSKEHIGKCAMFQRESKHSFGAFLSKITPNKDCPHFIFLFLVSIYFKQKIKSICNGTGINNLTNQTFDEVIFAYPKSNILEQFENLITPIFDKIGNNDAEIENLTQQRDELLPLLMNGQVSVVE